VQIDSTRYKALREKKKLPYMTFEMELPAGSVVGINIRDLIFNKKIDVGRINFREANVKLARHHRDENETDSTNVPLWKLIHPDIKSIRIGLAVCDNLKMSYLNTHDGSDFRWQFNQCNASFSGILIDSAATYDSSRLLFAKDIALAVKDVKMKTEDGLYNIAASGATFSSAKKNLEVKNFSFKPSISDGAFIRHFGYQHEIYKLKMPVIRINDFLVNHWVNYNELRAGTIELLSPEIAVSLDRNAPPYPNSKKGQYPHQLLQRAPFVIDVRKLTASDGTVIYTEKNNKNQLTGRLVFPAVRGAITNITNSKSGIKRSSTCVADVRSGVLKTGSLHAIFNFNLADKAGAFSVNATIAKLDAGQLQPLAKAMTSTDLQSFDMHELRYTINGNQNAGTGNLKMQYNNMDILINKVEPDGSFDKKGLLSFLANRLVIYKENPSDGEERTAKNVPVQRDIHRSFFNLVWKTLYSAAGEIVIRPPALRKMEKRKERTRRRAAEDLASEKK
jgi:hypothetical protein